MDFIFVTLLIISAQFCTTLANSPCVCPRNLSPVCGSDGITYGNPCLLGCAASTARKQITLARSGSCEEGLSDTVNRDCFCPAWYMPVCGSDGKTYGNSCELSCEKSFGNPSLEIASDGPCDTPSQRMASNDDVNRDCVCLALYAPVCGSDGKTYGNSCVLSCEKSFGNPSLEIANDGPCDTPSQRMESNDDVNRHCVCPAVYAPVCGSDGKTYSNSCLLSCAKSFGNPSLEIAHNGPCDTSTGRMASDDIDKVLIAHI